MIRSSHFLLFMGAFTPFIIRIYKICLTRQLREIYQIPNTRKNFLKNCNEIEGHGINTTNTRK